MSFSYDNNLAETKDKLRYLVQDTRYDGHFLEDEEIIFIASTEPNLYRAAAVLCRTIAANVNSMPGFNDKQIFNPEQKSAEYRKLAAEYDAKSMQNAGLSISASSIAANINNSAGVTGEPAFTRDLHNESSDN